MELKQYLLTIYKHRWVLMAGLVIGSLAGAYAVTSSPTEYRGSVTFFVSTTGEGTASSANLGDQFALRRVNSYLALLSTDRLAQMIVDDTGLDTTAAYVSGLIEGRADVNTVLLRASVSHPESEVALALAESLSREFVELVGEVENQVAGQDTVRLEVVSGPEVRQIPVRTKILFGTRIIAALGLAAAAVVVRELMDNRLHSIDQITEYSDAPLLGLIAQDKRVSQAPLILRDELRSTRAEAYRQLRTNLQFVDRESPAQVIVVTSSIPAEGKTTTAANLAIAWARSNQSVLLIDADLRRPTVADMFSLEGSVGLTDLLLGRVAIDDAIQPWGDSTLDVIPSGEIALNPAELLGTVATKRLIDSLRLRYDTIVIDAPPLLPVTDAALMSTVADGVVMIVRMEKVTRGQLQRALSLLERVDARVLGFVGSMLPERATEVYGTYGRTHHPEPTDVVAGIERGDTSSKRVAAPDDEVVRRP